MQFTALSQYRGFDSLPAARDNESPGGFHMLQQELFFQSGAAGRRVEVLKTYDQQFAREAFDSMDEVAEAFLWNSLKPEKIYPNGRRHTETQVQ